MCEVKDIFDPHALLNPGKIFPTEDGREGHHLPESSQLSGRSTHLPSRLVRRATRKPPMAAGCPGGPPVVTILAGQGTQRMTGFQKGRRPSYYPPKSWRGLWTTLRVPVRDGASGMRLADLQAALAPMACGCRSSRRGPPARSAVSSRPTSTVLSGCATARCGTCCWERV